MYAWSVVEGQWLPWRSLYGLSLYPDTEIQPRDGRSAYLVLFARYEVFGHHLVAIDVFPCTADGPDFDVDEPVEAVLRVEGAHL